MTWHVVYTEARAEPVVNHRLRAGGYETLWLHYPEWVRRPNQRQKHMVLRSYFPRYMFIAVEPGQGLWEINNTVGVSTVLFGASGPLVVPDDVIEELGKRADREGLLWEENRPVIVSGRRQYKEGETVELKAGPFAGFLATVALDNGGPRLKLWIEAFSGRVSAEAAPSDVRPGGAQRRQRVA